MATTQNTFNGNGSNLGPFSFTFKWLESTDIKVSVGGVLKTAGTHYNLQGLNYTTKTGGQVLFTAGNAPPVGTNNIRIYRDTDDEALSAVFSSGSAIRAKDLNDNFTQNLYVTQEINNNALNVDGSNPMVGPLNMNGFQITNLPVPAVDTNAATKKYVDDRFGNLDIPGHTRWRKVATASQTIFSGTGDYGGVLAYSPTREQVYINGALQQRGVDYAADNGTSIVFTVGLTVGDVVDIICVNNLTNSAISNAANINYSGQFSGQTARTVAAKLGDVVSVKDFGAVGNGTTDDTVAIQAALNSGKPVFMPAGNYLVTSELVIGAPYELYGAGALSTRILSACNGWTLKAGGGPGKFTLKDIHIQGTQTNQALATAKGFRNTTGGSQHEWLIEGCRFSYLLQAIESPEFSWTGAIREVYIDQCGTQSGRYAVEITGDSNNLLIDHLNIQSSTVGWQCRGLLIGALSPSTSNDPLGITLNHLYIENCNADYAVTIRTTCRIFGGYFESYAPNTTQINFDPVSRDHTLTIFGAHIGCPIIGRSDLVKLDACSLYTKNTTQQVSSRNPEFRWAQKLSNGVLPVQIKQTDPIPLSLQTNSTIKPRVFNLNGWDNTFNVVSDLNFSGWFANDNANVGTVVTNNDLRLGGTNVLQYSFNTNGSGTAFGGAMFCTFDVPKHYQNSPNYIYSYALVRKVRSDVDYQVVLFTSDPDQSSSHVSFSGTTNNDWHLLISAAPINTGMSSGEFKVGIRAFGTAGGSPPTNSTVQIHSIGAAIGGVPSFLASEPNELLIAKAESRRAFESDWLHQIYSQLVSTGGCDEFNLSLTFKTINVGGTNRQFLTTAVEQSIATPGTGRFPTVAVGCANTINDARFGSSVPGYAKRVYQSNATTIALPTY